METVDWNGYRVLLAVGRAGTVRGAAEALGTSHATVSRRLARLQDALGAVLLQKQGRRLVLTDAGRQVLAAAEQVEQSMVDLQRHLDGQDQRLEGTVRLALSMGLVPAVARGLPALAARHPGIEIEMSTGWDFRSLVRREADIALRVVAQPHDTLVGRKLAPFPITVFGQGALLDRHGDAPWSALPWIGWVGGDTVPMNRWLRQALPAAKEAVRVDNEASMHTLIREGVGVGFLPAILGDAEPALRRLGPKAPVFSMPLWVVTHPDLRRTPRIVAVVRWLASVLASEPGLPPDDQGRHHEQLHELGHQHRAGGQDAEPDH